MLPDLQPTKIQRKQKYKYPKSFVELYNLYYVGKPPTCSKQGQERKKMKPAVSPAE